MPQESQEIIEAELARIEARLAAYPAPFEHAGLFAAQQALQWAMKPEAFASPYDAVTGRRPGSEDCLAGSCPPPLSDSADNMGLHAAGR